MRLKDTDYWTFPKPLAPSIIDAPLPDDEMAPRSETLCNDTVINGIVVSCNTEATMDPLELLPRNMRITPQTHRTEKERQKLDPRNWTKQP